MTIQRGFLVGICLLITQFSIGQEKEISVLNQIPFTLTSHNNISIQAVINEVDSVDLMFHTATNSMTLIKEVTGSLSSISWDESTEVQSWGGKSEARFSEFNHIQIGPMKWDSISIWETEKSGPRTDGKIGPNFFKGYVIELDFDAEILTIHSALPAKASGYEKLNLIYKDEYMFIEGISTIEDTVYPNHFLIHSGYGGTILYDDQFVADSQIGKHIPITAEQELKDSYGNVLKTKKGILPSFKIGTHTFENIPVGFFEGTIGRQRMSVIGGNLLKRFNFIIGANRKHIYLKQNGLTKTKYKEESLD